MSNGALLVLNVLMSDRSPTQKQLVLSKLAKRARDLLDGTLPCPECGSTEPKDSNRGNETTYCCEECGEHFDVCEDGCS